jgi:DNA-3-methyladenine glycosylase
MSPRVARLPRAFYNRPTLEICPDLIGQTIVYDSPEGRLSARITEVEAYIGRNDPACHAARGMTERNRVMFGKPGVAYIYFIYGMYNCLNFVTEAEGKPAAILLRGAEPLEGLDLMRRSSGVAKEWLLLNGPGKFCRAFGLSREQNGLDLTGSPLYLVRSRDAEPKVALSPRIGIRDGQEKLWRFYDADSKAVSKQPARKE